MSQNVGHSLNLWDVGLDLKILSFWSFGHLVTLTPNKLCRLNTTETSHSLNRKIQTEIYVKMTGALNKIMCQQNV